MADLRTEFEMCRENIDLCTIYTTYILSTLCSLAALSLLLMTFALIMARNNKEFEHRSRSLFYATLIFFFISFCAEISQTLFNIFHGIQFLPLEIFYNVFVELYVLQYIVLIGIFYARLNLIFAPDTPLSHLRLSKLTKAIFSVLYIIAIIVNITAAVFWVNQSSFQPLLHSIIGLLEISFAITVIVLFIHKLYKVYSATDGQSDVLITALTKTSLLALASITISVIVLIFMVMSKFNPSVHFWFGRGLMACSDITSNALCMLLLFQSFNGIYMRLCGRCDAKCRRLCTRCAGKKEVTVELNVASKSTVSGFTSTTDTFATSGTSTTV